MKNMRRIKRMSRGRKRKLPGLNLVSLMDVFTILVFFLLVNSSNTEELSTPKSLELPESVTELKPDQTIVIMVTPTEVLLKGEAVASVAEVLAQDKATIDAIQTALTDEAKSVVGLTSRAKRRKAITIMGDKQTPFKVLKKVMASCTAAGYERISLAVIQKASQIE